MLIDTHRKFVVCLQGLNQVHLDHTNVHLQPCPHCCGRYFSKVLKQHMRLL